MANYYSTTKADATVSIQDFIALRNSDEITYYNYSILEYLNGYDMFITNLLYDYEDEINDLAVTIKLTNIERAKYRYKPYLLAYDIYGSTETKFILMMLNNIIDPKEFDFETIRALRPADLARLLNRINAVNDDFMSKMKSRLKADFKANEGNKIWA